MLILMPILLGRPKHGGAAASLELVPHKVEVPAQQQVLALLGLEGLDPLSKGVHLWMGRN
jgi:hypothetical protein